MFLKVLFTSLTSCIALLSPSLLPLLALFACGKWLKEEVPRKSEGNQREAQETQERSM